MRTKFTHIILKTLKRIPSRILRPNPWLENRNPTEFCKKFPKYSNNLGKTTNNFGNKIYFLHFNRTNTTTKNTIIFSHGNGSTLNIGPRLKNICDSVNCNGIVYDYSGYGASKLHRKQKITEELFNSDIECIYQYLVNECNIAPQNIILYGEHIGTGPTLHLAQKLESMNVNIGGVILETPIPSILRLRFPFLFDVNLNPLCKTIQQIDVMTNCETIKHINKCPILFISDEESGGSHFKDVLRLYDLSCRNNSNVWRPLWVTNSYRSPQFETVPHPEFEKLCTAIPRKEYFDCIQRFVTHC